MSLMKGAGANVLRGVAGGCQAVFICVGELMETVLRLFKTACMARPSRGFQIFI